MATSADQTHTRRDRRTVTALIAVWFLVTIAAVLIGVPKVEEGLTADAETALEGSSVDVRLDGRDATLTAAGSQQDAEAAQALVTDVDGIRSVSIELVDGTLEEMTVNPSTEDRPVEPVLNDPSVKITADREEFTISGSVANEATLQALTAAAIAAYGETRITANLSVDADTHQPTWLDDPFNLLSIVGRNDLGIEIYDKLMRVTGTVTDQATHDAVVEALETELAGALTVVDRVLVVPIEEPVFSMTSVSGSITLRGTLPSQGEVNSIRAAAEKIYGADSVATWLSVDTAAPAVPYLADAESFFRSFEGRTLEFVEIANTLTVRGLVPSEDIKASIGEALTAILEPRALVNELTVIEVSEETAAAIAAINDIIGSSLNFAPNSSDLSDDDQARLDEVAQILNDNASLRGVVEGHTDDLGSELGNERLSEERAAAVVDYLVGAGIDPDRLSTIGFGESRPIASNATVSGRAQNRRIEFNVEGSS